MKIKALLSLGFLAISASNAVAQTLVANDVGMGLIISPNVNGNLCAGYQDFIVKVSNYGNNAVTSFDLTWSLNGTVIGQRNFPTALNTYNQPNSTINTNLGMFQLAYNTPTVLKIWTSNPNGTTDNNRTNDTMTYTLTANDAGISLNPMNDTTICYNGTLTLDAGYNAYTDYSWSNGTQAQLNTITQPGRYWIWAYSNQGCQAFDTFDVTEIPEPQLGNLAIADMGQMNFNFSLSNPISVNGVSWNFGDGSPLETGLGSKSHQYQTPGTYTVEVTLSNDCGSILVSREVNAQKATSIKNIDDLVKAISLYPNPAKNSINITYPKNIIQVKSISILNIAGQVVYTTNEPQDLINIENLNTGLYQVMITTNKGVATKKIEIIK